MRRSIVKVAAGTAAVASLVSIMLLQPGMAQTPVPSATPRAGDNNLPQRTVTVVGNGQVDVAPDQAIARLGVQTEAATASGALADNTQQMQALLSSLTDAGVVRADIQTQSIQLYPRYAEPRSTVVTATPQIAGYIAANVVEVRVRNLDNLGTLLDAAVSAGGNTIENVRFVVSDTSARMDDAREAAVTDALRKARQLATLTGAQLGEVLSISEVSAVMAPFMAQAAMPNAGGAVPIEAGTQSLSTQVQVTWRLLGGAPPESTSSVTGTPLSTSTTTAAATTTTQPLLPSGTPTPAETVQTPAPTTTITEEPVVPSPSATTAASPTALTSPTITVTPIP